MDTCTRSDNSLVPLQPTVYLSRVLLSTPETHQGNRVAEHRSMEIINKISYEFNKRYDDSKNDQSQHNESLYYKKQQYQVQKA